MIIIQTKYIITSSFVFYKSLRGLEFKPVHVILQD